MQDAVPYLGLPVPKSLVEVALVDGLAQQGHERVQRLVREAEDVVAVVDHLKRDYGLNRYGLWGRSMGSVTALLYASGKAPDAACVVADSPFVNIKRLCYDLVRDGAGQGCDRL